MAKSRLSEEQLYYFEDQLCGDADQVYRFCLALCLNAQAAQKLLESTFESALESIETFMGIKSETQKRFELVRMAYGLASQAKESAVEPSALFAVLKSLPNETRAALVARDINGLSIQQIAQMTNLNDSDVYERIAHGRLALLAFVTKAQGA